MKRFKNGFYVVVRDNDKKMFYVSAKIYNDTNFINRILKAKENGRDVICSSDDSPREREKIIQDYKITYPDFQYTEKELV